MKKFLAITLCSLFAMAYGLNAQVTFEKTFGTTGDNFANDVQLTSDGGYILVGTAEFAGGFGDLLLIKTDANGDTLWTHTIGGSSLDQGNSVIQTSDGGYIIAGATMSYGAGANDAWLVKTDAKGLVTWSKTYGTINNDVAYGVVQTSDGGYVFSGMEKQSGLNGNAHLVKVDASGNVLWSKTFGSYLRKNFAYTLLQTSDHGFLIGGWENLNLGINDDFCLIKTDSNGTLQWYKSYGDVGHDQNFSVHQTTDGGFVIAGYTFSASVIDVNVVKVDGSGNLLWTKNVGGTGADYSYAVTSTADGGLVFCGSTLSFGATNAGYLAKMDGSGNLLWSKTMTGTGWDGFFAIREASDGGFVLAGVKGENYGVSGSVYFVKTDANGNSGCNNTVTSSVTTPSILVGTPIANGTSTQSVFDAAPAQTSGTSVTTICSSCIPVNWYADADNDGYGNAAVTQSSCDQPAGYVADNTDCDDAASTIHPGAADLCNGIDDNCDGVIDENAITATTVPSGYVYDCYNQSLLLTANAGNGILYQWYRNDVLIAGATNSTYSLNKGGKYFVKESNAFGCSSTSSIVYITIIPLPSANITPLGNLDICQTGYVDLQANSGGGYTYQWMKGSTNIAGATNQIYTATAKGTYKVVVTNAEGCSKTSKGVKVIKSCREGLTESTVMGELNVFPNPSSGPVTVDLKLNDTSSGKAIIQISNQLNQLVYTEEVAYADGMMHTAIKEESLPDGLYMLQVIIGDQIMVKSMMIQH
ncbi:MAG: hypothetical protein K1X63_06725 [Chitinophagales bacterium]|nr:hypothetical protein [Chitinophagales bacterium]